MDNRFARRSAGAGDFGEGEKMSELIDRQEAIEACMKYNGQGYIWSLIMKEIEQLPSAEPEQLSTNLASLGTDCISRQLRTCYDTETITMDNGDEYINYGDAVGEIEQLPTIQQDNGLQKLADEIASFKRCVKSENSDYLTGYLCALSVVEGMIADMRGEQDG